MQPATAGRWAGAIRAGTGREELVPAEGTQHVASEVEDDRAADKAHVGALKWPARMRKSACEEHTDTERGGRENKRAQHTTPAHTWPRRSGGVAYT